MIEQPSIDDETMTSLHARDAVTDAVLWFDGYRDSTRAAEELENIADRIRGGGAPAASEASTALAANVLSTVRLAEQEGADAEEIADVLERLAETLDEAGWGGVRAVAALQ
ncbi:hypothetical protein [Halopenitus persicus]|uniref:hypothetical protein n=1 Tax=Halopenitus persicus TaxID=1048396 RepID=UPI000BBA88AB|nr:hypothetical protein [Halopenitus persicus]